MTFCGVVLRNFEELLSVFLTTLVVGTNQGLHCKLSLTDLSHFHWWIKNRERKIRNLIKVLVVMISGKTTLGECLAGVRACELGFFFCTCWGGAALVTNGFLGLLFASLRRASLFWWMVLRLVSLVALGVWGRATLYFLSCLLLLWRRLERCSQYCWRGSSFRFLCFF